MAFYNLCVVIQNFKWLLLITGLTSKFDFRESGWATFNPSSLEIVLKPRLVNVLKCPRQRPGLDQGLDNFIQVLTNVQTQKLLWVFTQKEIEELKTVISCENCFDVLWFINSQYPYFITFSLRSFIFETIFFPILFNIFNWLTQLSIKLLQENWKKC